MARNVPRPNATSSGVAEGAVAVRFRFHVLDEHTVSHGIPYRVGPAIGVPGEHGGNVATGRIQWLPLPPAASRNARRTTPSVYVLSAPSEVVPWLVLPSMRMRGSASA